MTIRSRPVSIPCAGIVLQGEIGYPDDATGFIVFAHGSGSSRFSPRNQFVAKALQQRGFATLLFDLLTADEERIDAIDTTLRFDIDGLADRLCIVTDWVHAQQLRAASRIGYFGASTGAAAALLAAARRPDIRAVVSRGGRPDLAGRALAEVLAPTLLIVGGRDRGVIELNRAAANQLASCELVLVPGATHLFEEPGALGQVATLAGDWFARHLVAEIASREATP